VDQERKPASAEPPEETLQASMVVGVTVGDDDRAELLDRDLEDVEVSAQRGWGQATVVEQ